MRARIDIGRIAATLAGAVVLAAPVWGHHSFAMYDLRITKVVTGVVQRVDPAPNHLAIFFATMNPDRKNVERDANGEPIIWSVEMAGSAAMARQGVSVNSFPPGTVFSIGFHPLRIGAPPAPRQGGLFVCPHPTPPAPGMHCDSVEGHVQIGTEQLPTPTENATGQEQSNLSGAQ
jgi:hypothetical protein